MMVHRSGEGLDVGRSRWSQELGNRRDTYGCRLDVRHQGRAETAHVSRACQTEAGAVHGGGEKPRRGRASRGTGLLGLGPDTLGLQRL